MKKISVARLGVLAGILALLIAGCVKPPVAEKTAAETAKNSAVAAQAETYAVAAMAEAMKLWDNAEVKMKARAYDDAKAGYLAAKAAFDLATGQVEAGKKAISEENQAALKLVEQSWAEVSKLSVKKVAKLETALKAQWDADSKAVPAALQKAKDAAANPAEVKKALADAKALLDKWMEKFKK